MRRAVKWADWLDARFVTRDVTKSGAAPSTPAAVQAAAPVSPIAPVASNRVPAAAVQAAPPGPRTSASYVPRKLIMNDQ
jgi:hypothetical protein